MKNGKKFAALMLSAVFALSLAACGSSTSNTEDGNGDGNTAETGKTVETVDDLSGARIGVQTGTTGDIFVTDYEGDEAGTVVERYNKGVDAVMALKQGKLDCVMIDSEPAQVFVSENDDLKILDETFAEEEYAICVDKSNAELTEKINEAMAKLKEEGVLDEIIGHWIGDDADQASYESPEGISYDNGTLVMATNAEFPPYESLDGDEVVGIDADIARAIADELGMELQIDNMEFDSIIAAVTSGKADIGAAGMTVTEDRLKNVDFTDSYATSTQVIIVRK